MVVTLYHKWLIIRRLFRIQTLKHATLKGRRVLTRVDFNALDGDGMAEYRIREAMRTLRLVLSRGGLLRVISHRGRPGGRRVKALSLSRVSRRLERMLGRKVAFIKNPFDENAFRRMNHSPDIIFFENIRFWKGEEANDVRFARALARWGDIYVNEAFSVSHRAHASVHALARMLPACAGIRFVQEIKGLSRLLGRIRHPFIAVIGGAKLETKLFLLRKFLGTADTVLVAGESANAIARFKKINVGRSRAGIGMRIQKKIIRSKKILLPVDYVVSESVSRSIRARTVARDAVPRSAYIVDAGPRTIRFFSRMLQGAKTIVWNGPLGNSDVPAFRKGTRAFARSLARSRAFTVVGGGDTVAVLYKSGLLRRFSHVSTGGSAMLEFLAYGTLPGIDALKSKLDIKI